MAYAFKQDQADLIVICFDRHPPVPESYTFTMRSGSHQFVFTETTIDGNMLALKNLSHEFERAILFAAPMDQLAATITDNATGKIVFAEIMFLHHSVYRPLFDFAKSFRLPPFLGPDYVKPALLAIFTHVYNDNEMLKVWQRHHSQMVDYRHLWVIDHGSDERPQDVLHKDVNVVRIPRGEVDHDNISQFCNYFQRFLLSQYRWVAHTDADELFFHVDGAEALRQFLAAEPDGTIIKPGQQYTFIHDPRCEPAIDLSNLISRQRSRVYHEPNYEKPLLTSVPATWTQGFHSVLEDPVARLNPQLCLIHLAYMDLGLTLQKNARWKAMSQSERDQKYVPHHTKKDDPESLGAVFISRADDAETFAIPEWMVGAF